MWAKFWIATAVPLILSSSNTTDSKGVTRMIYSVWKGNDQANTENLSRGKFEQKLQGLKLHNCPLREIILQLTNQGGFNALQLAHMGRMRNAHRVLEKKTEEITRDFAVDGWVELILKLSLKEKWLRL